MRILSYSIGEQTAIVIAHISGRSAYEFGNGMLFGIFAHVETQKFDTKFVRQHLCHFGLTHTSRSHKQQRRQWLVLVEQSCARHLHGFNHLFYSVVLTINLTKHSSRQCFQTREIIFFAFSHCIYLTSLRQDGCNILLAHFAVTLFQLHRRTCLVNDIYSLVWQESLIDILSACLHSIIDGLARIHHTMKLLIS